ncbi:MULTISPECIES: hypothetical protein [Aerococcus]|uniref:hypothetical protein n=1 Tax=Aerococcus TaxID=1375 RepID=UPI000DCE26D3|nr:MULTISPECIES: hypothetical protein [Aerococcus]KAA9296003.1 hypothetical protein F6I08_08940 [Aerococcus tenax]MDK6689708.1 hypothetical protein [Aerococcus urinae]MDK8133002.1 hypothetical protein [Aerococcus urinae]MDK8484560.1 hypothetical protein [Aerococcus urinae]MDL5179407.1 hypothetical protein [Aerococcus tenax]
MKDSTNMQSGEKSIKTEKGIFQSLEIAVSEEEFDNKLEHSYSQFLAKEGRPLEDVFRELEKGLE